MDTHELNHPARQSSEGLERKAHFDERSDGIGDMTEFMTALADFRETNDRRLAELEKRGANDPLTLEKLKRIEDRLDGFDRDLMTSRRPALEAASSEEDVDEIRSAFQTYVRKGRTEDLDDLSTKGLSVGSEADGGFLVSPEVDQRLERKLLIDSPMRTIARVMTISTSVYKKPFVKSGAASGWVAETASRPETNAPQLAELSLAPMELYAIPAVTKQLLDDAFFDVEDWLASELNSAFSEKESAAFISGDGVASPKGLLTYPRQKSTNPDQGKIGYNSTGAAGSFSASAPADPLFDLVHSLPLRYRKNGKFLMNRTTLSAVRRIKDENGNYLIQPNLNDALEMRLLGYPVIEYDDMPEISAGSASIAFGDFERGYLIVDRHGVQILRDPYSAKPYVLFYATKRVGGGVADSAAIRLLTFSV